VYKITWSSSARNDYLDIVDYLLDRWGKKSALKFKNSVNNHIRLISKMPAMNPLTNARENVRRCVVASQVSMYYLEELSDNEIFIVRFVDNRKNPDDLSETLNESDL
jgi:plasmid stabilization system protein ParE